MIAIPSARYCSFLGAPLLETSAQETIPLCSEHLAYDHDLELSFRKVKSVKQVRWRTHLFRDDVCGHSLHCSFWTFFFLCVWSLIGSWWSFHQTKPLGTYMSDHIVLDIWQRLLCFLSFWLLLMWSHTKWLSMPHSVSVLLCGRKFSCWRVRRHVLFFSLWELWLL